MVFSKNATSASTENGVDNPYELPGITALLNGSGFHIGRQDLLAPNLYDDRQYSAYEVRVLIALALDAYSRQLRADIREDMFSALDQLELRLLNKIDNACQPPIAKKATVPLPPAGDITKLYVEYYDNRHQRKRGQRGGRPNFQLVLHAWNCPAEDHPRYPEGNLGYWYAPIHDPNHVDGRKRIINLMPFIDELGRDSIHKAGAIQFESTSIGNQSCYVTTGHRLLVRLAGDLIDMGLPRTKQPDHDKDAPIFRWTWPDCYAD